jgi:hypothetical protein
MIAMTHVRRSLLPLAALSLGAVLALAPATPAQTSPSGPASSEAPAEPTMLRLYDGSILWGSIVGHDAETLHFERLDNGGRLFVPWSRLDPALADELLEEYGYVDHSGDELMIETDWLKLTDGTEVIGQIVNRTENELWVKTSTTLAPVPLLKIQGSALRIQVPALDVFTREELYQQELVKLDPASAQSQWDLSIHCERIYDFKHAVEHLEAARKLDPAFKPSEIATAISRNAVKVDQQTQLDALREVDSLRIRGRFDDALKAVETFLAAFEKSPLVQDAFRKKAQVEKSREQKLRERAAEVWHALAARLTRNKAREKGLTFEAAVAWVDEGLANELIEAATKEVQRTVSPSVTPDQVRRYWKERKPGRWRRASYGQGTWLLGLDDARRGLVDDETQAKESKPGNEADADRKRLEDRIKKYMQAQEMQRKAQGKAEGEESEQEAFWKEFPVDSRGFWMLAYFAEHSGDFELDKPIGSNCPDCGGRGKREILNAVGRQNQGQGNQPNQGPSGGSTTLVDCPMCHAVGIFRRVRYR